MNNIEIVKNNKVGLISLVSLISICILNIFFWISEIPGIIHGLSFPLITVSLTVFSLYLFNKRLKVNKALELVGKESYSIFLLHLIPISILSLVFANEIIFSDGLTLAIMGIILIVIICVFLCYPFTYLENWLIEQKQYHRILIKIIISLIVYGIIANILLFYYIFEPNDMFSFLLYLIIISSVFLITYLLKYK